jgi:hypothetical protein
MIYAGVVFKPLQSIFAEVLIDEIVPIVACLMHSVQGLHNLAYVLWSLFVNKSGWLAHVDVFCDLCVQVCIADVNVHRRHISKLAKREK